MTRGPKAMSGKLRWECIQKTGGDRIYCYSTTNRIQAAHEARRQDLHHHRCAERDASSRRVLGLPSDSPQSPQRRVGGGADQVQESDEPMDGIAAGVPAPSFLLGCSRALLREAATAWRCGCPLAIISLMFSLTVSRLFPGASGI